MLSGVNDRRTIDDLLAEAQSSLQRLTPAAAAAAVDDGWLLVDIRSADIRAVEGTIPGAVHAPRTVLEWRVDPRSGFQEPAIAGREDRLILICSHGYSSSLAAVALRELGFPATTDVVGGFEAWRAAGLPVEDGAWPAT
jgi:rhodanese-related sulfurtransferase